MDRTHTKCYEWKRWRQGDVSSGDGNQYFLFESSAAHGYTVCEEKLGISGGCSSSDAEARGDLSSNAGLAKLNSYLADHSYIEGYMPSQADITVYKALGKRPDAQHIHIVRYEPHNLF